MIAEQRRLAKGLTPEEKLLLKIKQDENGCWNVTDKGHTLPIYYWDNGEFLDTSAYRYAMQLIHGDIDGKTICHKCDNQACVNPSHLYIGDGRTNALDRNVPTRKKIEMLKRGESLPWWNFQSC